MAEDAGVPGGQGSLLSSFGEVMGGVADSLQYSAKGSDTSRALFARDLEDLAEEIAFWMGISQPRALGSGSPSTTQ